MTSCSVLQVAIFLQRYSKEKNFRRPCLDAEDFFYDVPNCLKNNWNRRDRSLFFFLRKKHELMTLLAKFFLITDKRLVSHLNLVA